MEDESHITEEELLAEIEDTAQAMDANLNRRVKWKGTTLAQVIEEDKKKIIFPTIDDCTALQGNQKFT